MINPLFFLRIKAFLFLTMALFPALVWSGPKLDSVGKMDVTASHIRPSQMTPLYTDPDSSGDEKSRAPGKNDQKLSLADLKKMEKKEKERNTAMEKAKQFKVSPQKSASTANPSILRKALPFSAFLLLDYWQGSYNLFPEYQPYTFYTLVKAGMNGFIPSDGVHIAQTSVLLGISSAILFALSKGICHSTFYLFEKIEKSSTFLKEIFCKKKIKEKK